MRFYQWFFMFLLGGVMIAGCSFTPKELEDLDITLMAYERHIRWGNYTHAQAMHHDAAPISDLEHRRLKMFRVTGYKTLQRTMQGTKKCFIVAEIRYYHNERAVERSLTHRQEWNYDEKTKLWKVTAPFPSFR